MKLPNKLANIGRWVLHRLKIIPEKYKVETFVFAIGIGLTIASLCPPFNSPFAGALIASVTFMTNVSILSIKAHIDTELELLLRKMLDFLLPAHQIFNSMRDENFPINKKDRWFQEAKKSIEAFTNKLQGISEGRIDLQSNEVSKFQEELLSHTTESLCAIHIAENNKALDLWDPQSKSPNLRRSVYRICKEMSETIAKKRIFVLGEQYTKSNPIIQRVLKDQTEELKFEIKIIYLSDVAWNPNLCDLLLSDSKEIVRVFMRYNHLFCAHASINPKEVNEAKSLFNKFWEDAEVELRDDLIIAGNDNSDNNVPPSQDKVIENICGEIL